MPSDVKNTASAPPIGRNSNSNSTEADSPSTSPNGTDADSLPDVPAKGSAFAPSSSGPMKATGLSVNEKEKMKQRMEKSGSVDNDEKSKLRG